MQATQDLTATFSNTLHCNFTTTYDVFSCIDNLFHLVSDDRVVKLYIPFGFFYYNFNNKHFKIINLDIIGMTTSRVH